jgi:ribose transport system permease protein
MIPLHKFLALTQSHRWIWSALAVLIFWGALSVVTDRFSVASLSGIVLSASYLSIVGVGQMFVVTTGRGNIDLSIASVVTLSAYVALLTIGGRDANLPWGLLVALGLGLVVGSFNAALVVPTEGPRHHRDAGHWLCACDCNSALQSLDPRLRRQPDLESHLRRPVS